MCVSMFVRECDWAGVLRSESNPAPSCLWPTNTLSKTLKFAKCYLKRCIQRRLAKLQHERAAVKRVWLECKTRVMVITLSPCLFWLWGPIAWVCGWFYCFGALSALSSTLFPAAAGSCFQRSSAKRRLYTRWTDKVSNVLVNIVEHVVATEPDISLRSWWRAKMRVNTEFTFVG